MLQLLRRIVFSEDERSIIAALRTDSLAAPAISRRLREASDGPSTRLKILLSNLCNRGVLDLTREGYKLTDERLIEVAREGNGGRPPGVQGAPVDAEEGEGEESTEG